MSAFLQLLLATICSGIAAVLFKFSTQSLGAANTTFFYYIFGTLWAFILWQFVYERIPFERSSLVWPALTALFLAISVVLFTTVIKSMPLSVATPIYGMSFLVASFIGIFLLGEPILAKHVVALFFAVASVLVFSLG